MPFISDREERAELQNAIYDDGSIHSDFSETFDAAVGFSVDEGLSTSRMLNNEMYERRRARAKEIFDSGVPRDEFYNERGEIDYNEMSTKHEGIKPDWELFEEKKTLLEGRRNYYNDVMRRSDSVSGNLLGSMTGFMMDPINLATMAVATPFAAAKGVGVLGRALYGGAGAAAVNVATEMLIQPFVLDYKLDIDSPYGMDDAITNIAMAAGGGFVLGGMAGGISGWLRKIRADADDIKLSPDLDVDELKMAVDQVDEMINTLDQNPIKFKAPKGKSIFHGTDKSFEDFDVKEAADGTIWFTDDKTKIEKGEVGASGKGQIMERIIDEEDLKLGGWDEVDRYSTGELMQQGYDGVRLKEDGEVTYQIFYPEKLKKPVTATEAHMKQVEADAAYLREGEAERVNLNRTPDEVKIEKMQEITDSDLDGAFRAMDEPAAIVDGEFVDAKKIVDSFDNDIAELEAMKVCMLG